MTVLAALPSDDYRVRKNRGERITYLLPPVDGRSKDYQVMWIGEGDRVVVLPWSPPPTPCAEASGTSFKDVDTHGGADEHDLLAAVVVDGWMVLSSVDTGEIVDQRFGDLHEEKSEFDPRWMCLTLSILMVQSSAWSRFLRRRCRRLRPRTKPGRSSGRMGRAVDGTSPRTASSGNGMGARRGPVTSICAVLVWRMPSRTESTWMRAS